MNLKTSFRILTLPIVKRLPALATVAIPLVILASNANAEIYTLTFDGNSKLVPEKGDGLLSFTGIKKIKVKFESFKPLLPGVCSQFQSPAGLAGSWSLVSFTDGSNTYTKAKGFSSPLSPTWVGFNWAFEACLNSASQLTNFNGLFRGDSSSDSTSDTVFENDFNSTGPVAIYVGYGSDQTSYQGQYGFSIGIDFGYNYETATTFDAYNGKSPTILYKP